MKIKDVNIGLAIEQTLISKKMSKSEFGRRIGVMQQNVNRILERESIDTDKLIKISEALDYNFFKDFVDSEETSTPPAAVSASVHHNQVSGDGASVNVNGGEATAEVAMLRERVNAMQRLLDEKDKILDERSRLLDEKERTIKILLEKK